MNWSYDDEGKYWQVYCDYTSYSLPRWLPEFVPRWMAAFLRLVRPVR